MKRKREERDGLKKGDGQQRLPTLPKLGGQDDDASSIFSGVTRSDTISTATTLPPYSSNPPTRTNTMNTMSTSRAAAMRPTLPSLSERPPMPSRSNTQATSFSTASYGSNAPLLDQAGDMGMASPLPPMPVLDQNAEYFNGPHNNRLPPNGLPGRPFSPMSQGRGSPAPLRNGLPPLDTGYGDRDSPASRLASPPPNDYRSVPNRRPGASPLSGPTFSPYDNRGPAVGPSYEMSPVDITASDNTFDAYQPPQLPSALRPGSPTQVQNFGPPPRVGTAPPNVRPGIPASLQSAIQRREASQPLAHRGMPTPQQRSVTAPLGQSGWGPGPDPTARSNTTTPGSGYNAYHGY